MRISDWSSDVCSSDLLHFEIGFGSGEHLAYRADLLPDHGFIGCEPFLNGVVGALGHVRDEHLANVRLHMGDALEVLERLPDASLRFVYLLHPDPWPTARHEIGRAHVCTPVTNALLVCRLPLEQKN